MHVAEIILMHSVPETEEDKNATMTDDSVLSERENQNHHFRKHNYLTVTE